MAQNKGGCGVNYPETLTTSWFDAVVVKKPPTRTERLTAPVEPPERLREFAERDFMFVASDEPPTIRWKYIVADVARRHHISVTEMIGAGRNRYLVRARHEAFYRVQKETAMSTTQIGRCMGGFDHTSVMHGIRRHEERMRAE